MRSGELLALRPADIIGNVMQVRRTASDDTDGVPRIKNEPKTSAGRRNIPLPALAQTAVEDELKRRCDSLKSTDLLFATSNGGIHRRNNIIRRHFRPAIKKAELPLQMTMHDLRHTYATLALNDGIGVHLISKLLGHASVKVTIDLCGHALPDATAEAADQVNNLFVDA